MSAFQYSQGSVETKIIDSSHYVPNKYVEFRLDEENVNYLSDIRLINMGLTSSNTPDVVPLGGYLNMIKHVELLSGREVLCSGRHIAPYLAFQQTRQPNEQNKSVSNFLLKSDYAYQAKNGGISTGGGGFALTADSATTPKSHVSLKDCLPLLENLPALNSNTFPNMVIRIEFESNPVKLISTVDVVTTTEPSLVVDIVRGKMALPQQVMWVEIEHDEYTLVSPTTAPTEVTQPIKVPNTIRINAFNNKMVNRMLLVKRYSDDSKNPNDHSVKNGSLSLFKEELGIRVNGRALFPEGVIDKDSVRSHICEDAWGIQNVVQHYNKINSTDSLLASSQIGKTDYNGFVIDDELKDLQIEHNRSCIADSSTSSQYNSEIKVHCYAEVRKFLNVKGGEFSVSYV